MAYIGENGRSAFRGELSYDLPITQRLILQPNIEINAYGKDDPERDIGSGLSDADVAVRLRYEFWREFAPYIGISYQRKYGQTADYARAQGEEIDETRVMVLVCVCGTEVDESDNMLMTIGHFR
jgi:copper resistance protein B